VKAVWKTGVETEALTAAAMAALALFDVLKRIDETLEITSIKLTTNEKSLGRKKEGVMNRHAAVLVLSDRRASGKRDELSGKIIKERLEKYGLHVMELINIPDEASSIERELLRLCDEALVDLVITSGGTGVGPHDLTPDITSKILHRTLPGINEFLRSQGEERSRHSVLSRGVAGIRGKSIIVNLPGSPGGVNDSLDLLLPWLFRSFPLTEEKSH